MRHRKAGIKISRTSSHRDAMFRNMVTSLFKHDKLRTTDVKAKELSRWADRIITLAKRGDLHARRQAMAIVREKNVVHKLFEEAEKRFGDTNGGYTRIVKIGRRPGDAAPISLIELVAIRETDSKMKKSKIATKKQERSDTPKKSVKRADEQPKAENSTKSIVAQSSEKTTTKTIAEDKQPGEEAIVSEEAMESQKEPKTS